MEFKTSSFTPATEQPTSNNWLIYLLLTIIFFLVYYLLNQFGITGWPIFLAAFGFFGMAMWMRYHNLLKKENIKGTLDKEIELTPEFFRVDDLTIQIDRIKKIVFNIDKYEGQLKADSYTYPELMKSDGVSNKITVVTHEGSYSELFRLANQRHYHDLILTTRELKKNGIDIEINDKF